MTVELTGQRRAKPGKALASQRKARCVELALAGHSYDDIAAKVGYKNRGTAWKVVMNALAQNVAENVDSYREIELARLDALQAAHWPDAISGQVPKSAELVLKIIVQRSKLLGLESQVAEAPSQTLIVSSSSYVNDLKTICGELVS